MAITQAEAVATLEDGQRQLDALLAALDEEQLMRPATIGEGDWSAGDLVAHVAFWEEIALRSAAEWRAGQTPWIEAIFQGKQVDEVNAENQEQSRAMSWAEVRQRASTAHQQLVGLVTGMTEAEWTAKASYRTERRENLGMMLASVTGAPKRGFGHAFAHLPDLQEYVASVAGPA